MERFLGELGELGEFVGKSLSYEVLYASWRPGGWKKFPKVGIVFLLGIVHKVLLELAQKGWEGGVVDGRIKVKKWGDEEKGVWKVGVLCDVIDSPCAGLEVVEHM